MAWYMARFNRADGHITFRPYFNWFVCRLESDDIDKVGRTAGQTLLVLGKALCDLAGLNKRIATVAGKPGATEGMACW